MNTDQLARATFVLDRVTADRLSVISKRMGVSRSALVRDVLEEPIALMAKWVESLPDDGTGRIKPEHAQDLFRTMEADIDQFLDDKQAALTLLTAEGGGHG